jgi:hypothetical protein
MEGEQVVCIHKAKKGPSLNAVFRTQNLPFFFLLICLGSAFERSAESNLVSLQLRMWEDLGL